MSGRSGVADGDVADGGLPRRNIKQLAAPNKCWPCQHRQKALHEKAVRNRTNIRTGPSSQVPQMLQSLLADRFHLAFHHETRTVSAYELGLGSSGALTVALVRAISTYCHQDRSPADIAELACHIELTKLQAPVGKQDQYAA